MSAQTSASAPSVESGLKPSNSTGGEEDTSHVPSYSQIRADLAKMVEDLGSFVRSGRRPHYLSEEASVRLMSAFDALLDEALDDDDELDEEINCNEVLEKVRVLRAFAGL